MTIVMLENFSITCKKCGSSDVAIKDETRSAGDGGGYVDRWGEVYISCNECHQLEDIYENN